MGTKVAPSYAGTFMSTIDDAIRHAGGNELSMYLRYIDDCFGIWEGKMEDFTVFMERCQRINPAIKFDFTYSYESVQFLDTIVYANSPSLFLATDLYIKPTDSRQFLLYSSYQPASHKNHTPYSQALRIARICSDPTRKKFHLDELKDAFRRRGYPSHTLSRIDVANRKPREELLKEKTYTVAETSVEKKCIPLVLEYHESWKELESIFIKLRPILETLPVKTTIYWKAPKKIKNFLVRSRFMNKLSNPPSAETAILPITSGTLVQTKLDNFLIRTQLTDNPGAQDSRSSIKRRLDGTPCQEITLPCDTSAVASSQRLVFKRAERRLLPTGRTSSEDYHHPPCPGKSSLADQALLVIPKGGTYPCLRQGCRTCPFLITGDSFKSSTTGLAFKIRHRFDCRSQDLVYLITCARCHVQYVGETGNSLSQRFAGHRSNCKNFQKYPTPVSCHFNGHHFVPPAATGAAASARPEGVCSIGDLKLQGIAKTQGKIHRKYTEMYYISQIMSDLPYGINFYHPLNSKF